MKKHKSINKHCRQGLDNRFTHVCLMCSSNWWTMMMMRMMNQIINHPHYWIPPLLPSKRGDISRFINTDLCFLLYRKPHVKGSRMIQHHISQYLITCGSLPPWQLSLNVHIYWAFFYGWIIYQFSHSVTTSTFFYLSSYSSCSKIL
jgi:hypothetical protein